MTAEDGVFAGGVWRRIGASAREEKCWWMWRRNARYMGIYREGEC
jgi:hypothetical protein